MSVPHRAYVSAEKGNVSVDISPQRQKTTGMPGPPLPRRRAGCVFDLNQITGSRQAAMFLPLKHHFVSPVPTSHGLDYELRRGRPARALTSSLLDRTPSFP